MAFAFNSRSAASRDLFDDTTMSFGEHLEVLRTHLIRSLLWLTIGFVVALIFSRDLIVAIQRPVNAAMMTAFSQERVEQVPEGPGPWEKTKEYVSNFFSRKSSTPEE